MDASFYRARLAPSPTGFLHLGHGTIFLIAQKRARDAGGDLVLRIEDLDHARCRPEFADAIIDDLREFGLSWNEGPDVGGPFAPYRQSERGTHYFAAWQKLRDAGAIYPCTCSRKDVAAAASAPHAEWGRREASHQNEEPIYPGTCRLKSGSEFSEPAGVNWRVRVPDGEEISFIDGGVGEQRAVAGRDFGDFVVWRRDDVPAYQLAVVVDDAAMQITEVVRGEDLLLSTFRQLLLYRALALTPPLFFHAPLVVDESGVRLAKRNAALSLRELRQRGGSR
ncbi:MAG: tRNA glutamyl-Q(34) synthetase GluQRS [Verrucomicrobiota bacterium]|nr:tRNA glutamyl-Q(34) synthetase GluQRS [Verrucomicrobiota bacterium]